MIENQKKKNKILKKINILLILFSIFIFAIFVNKTSAVCDPPVVLSHPGLEGRWPGGVWVGSCGPPDEVENTKESWEEYQTKVINFAKAEELAKEVAKTAGIQSVWFWWSGPGGELDWRFRSASYLCAYDNTLPGCQTTTYDPDLCANIEEEQTVMPKGFRDVGGRICQLNKAEFSIICTKDKNPVKTNQRVTFKVSPFNQSRGVINYVWKNFNDGKRLASKESNDFSSFSTSSSTEGLFQIKVTAMDSQGRTAESVCAVSVSNSTSSSVAIISGNTSTSSSNSISTFSVGNSEITLILKGNGLTNDTCPIEWTSKNVIECYLTRTSGESEQIPLNGVKNLTPGNRIIRCISSSPTADLIETKTINCRLNPNSIQY